jgi:hypothetical protein
MCGVSAFIVVAAERNKETNANNTWIYRFRN